MHLSLGRADNSILVIISSISLLILSQQPLGQNQVREVDQVMQITQYWVVKHFRDANLYEIKKLVLICDPDRTISPSKLRYA